MITIDIDHMISGSPFIVVSNKTGPDFERCFEAAMKNLKSEVELMKKLEAESK